MQNMWNENLEKGKIVLPHEDETYQQKQTKLNKSKKAMKDSIKETLNNWNKNVKMLTFQGNFLSLLIEEKENIS